MDQPATSDNQFYIRYGEGTTSFLTFNKETTYDEIQWHALMRFSGTLPNAWHIGFYSWRAKRMLVLTEETLKLDYSPFSINTSAIGEITESISIYPELLIIDDTDIPLLSSLFRNIMSSLFTCVSCRNKRSKKRPIDLDDIWDSLPNHNLTRVKLIETVDSDHTSDTFSLQPMVKQTILLSHDNSLDQENVSINTSRGSLTSSITVASTFACSHAMPISAEQLKTWQMSNEIDSIFDEDSLNLQSNLSRTQSHDERWIDDDEITKLFNELSTLNSTRTLNPTLSCVSNNASCENGNVILNKHLSNLSNLLTIHKQIEKQEYGEHQQLHGSKPNIYEYEIKKQAQKQHLTKSQTSDGTEKSCY